MRAAARTHTAFTLVELLVVVAIIALLLGILIPSLGKARKLAQSVACMAHLKGAGAGVQIYQSENDGYLPGPNTSGYGMSVAGESYTFDNDPQEPVQNHDWVSPTLAKELNLDEDRKERMREIFNTKLRCPSNNDFFKSEFNTSIFTAAEVRAIRYSSYSANWWVILTSLVYRNANDSNMIYINADDAQLPYTYGAHIDRVGSPAAKVWAMDGAQDIDRNSDDTPTFNGQKEAFLRGNNYTSNGPVIDAYNGSPYYRNADGTLSEKAKRYAYRHDEKLNVTFLDGHVESMNNEESRAVEMYFPKDTVIMDASNTVDPDDVDGQVID